MVNLGILAILTAYLVKYSRFYIFILAFKRKSNKIGLLKQNYLTE